jgi:hypothetical protein
MAHKLHATHTHFLHCTYSHTHTHTHSHTHTHTYNIHSYTTHIHTHSRTHTCTNVHTYVLQQHILTLSHFHPLSLSHTLPLSLTLSFSHTHSLTLHTLSHTLTPFIANRSPFCAVCKCASPCLPCRVPPRRVMSVAALFRTSCAVLRPVHFLVASFRSNPAPPLRAANMQHTTNTNHNTHHTTHSTTQHNTTQYTTINNTNITT